MGEQKVKKTYSLSPTQIAAIEEVAKIHGASSASAGLRFIIDDWVRRCQAEAKAKREKQIQQNADSWELG